MPSTDLKLCDSSVADFSSRGCIFTPIESFHFVVQLPHKVDLQRAGAWGGVHRESCTVLSAKGGKINSSDDKISRKQGQPTA